MTTTVESIRSYPRKALERVAFRVFLNADQLNLTDNSWNKVNFNAREYDLGLNFDITTNYRFDVPVAGLYLLTTNVLLVAGSVTVDTSYGIGFFVNGNAKTNSINQPSANAALSLASTELLYLNEGDYAEVKVYPNAVGGNTLDLDGAASGANSNFSAVLLSKEGVRV